MIFLHLFRNSALSLEQSKEPAYGLKKEYVNVPVL